MVAVESSDQAAVCKPDFDPAEYVRKIFGMYPDDLCTVELLCDNEVMRSVIDRFGEDVSTVTADDGHFKAIVEVAPSPPFFASCFANTQRYIIATSTRIISFKVNNSDISRL